MHVDGCARQAERRPGRPVVHGFLLAAAEMVTLCAASGYVVHFLSRPGRHVSACRSAGNQAVREPPHRAHDVEHIDVDVPAFLRKS